MFTNTVYKANDTEKVVKCRCALEKPYPGLFTFLVMHVNLDLMCSSKSMILSWFFQEFFLLLIVQTLQP